MSKLDRYDLSILAELQRDARISNQELAERIGLSPSPCSRRVKQLEDDGYIARQVSGRPPSGPRSCCPPPPCGRSGELSRSSAVTCALTLTTSKPTPAIRQMRFMLFLTAV